MKTKTRGFTLIELIVALTIGGILVALAIPSFQSLLLKYRLNTRSNNFYMALNLARSEAVKRNGIVTVCQSSDSASCTTSGGWQQGWIVFYDVNGNGVIDTPDCMDSTKDCIIRTGAALESGYTLSGATPGGSITYLSFSSSGLNPGAKAAFNMRHSPDVEDRNICLDISGRAKILKSATSGAAPSCP